MRNEVSTSASEKDGHVIRLFGTADPVRHGFNDHFTDLGERLAAVLLNQFDQALRAEFAGFVLGFGDPVAEWKESWTSCSQRGFRICLCPLAKAVGPLFPIRSTLPRSFHGARAAEAITSALARHSSTGFGAQDFQELEGID